MFTIMGTVAGTNLFGNKEILEGGRISRFCTVLFQKINPHGVQVPNLLYSDYLVGYRQGGFWVSGHLDSLLVFDKDGLPIRSLESSRIQIVRNVTRTRVTAGGWLAQIDDYGRIKLFDRRDLPLVRKAKQAIKPPAFSERYFFRVEEKYWRRVMYIFEMGHELLPVYRVFDPRGNPVSFYQHYPLSYSKWKEGEKP